jgi:hypothetical protein
MCVLRAQPRTSNLPIVPHEEIAFQVHSYGPLRHYRVHWSWASTGRTKRPSHTVHLLSEQDCDNIRRCAWAKPIGTMDTISRHKSFLLTGAFLLLSSLFTTRVDPPEKDFVPADSQLKTEELVRPCSYLSLHSPSRIAKAYHPKSLPYI